MCWQRFDIVNKIICELALTAQTWRREIKRGPSCSVVNGSITGGKFPAVISKCLPNFSPISPHLENILVHVALKNQNTKISPQIPVCKYCLLTTLRPRVSLPKLKKFLMSKTYNNRIFFHNFDFPLFKNFCFRFLILRFSKFQIMYVAWHNT